jgi:hypothetical protein
MSEQDRKTILLRATYDMLKQANQAHYVMSPLEIITHYDDADCDGFCLMQDIADELGIEEWR